MFAGIEIGCEHVCPGDVESGAPLCELIEGRVVSTVDCVFEYADIGACGDEQSYGGAFEYEDEFGSCAGCFEGGDVGELSAFSCAISGTP